jgi:hypothetical protein
MTYSFNSKVDEDLFQRTSEQWRALIDADPENMSSTYYDAILQHCRSAISGKTFGNGKGALCAVVAKGSTIASAFVIVTSIPNKQLRMLDVTVAPDLNAANREPERSELAWIAATAIVGCLEMTYAEFPCRELKLHAGWPLDRDFLTAITTAMKGNSNFGSLFEVSSHGNWILLTKPETDSSTVK